MLEYQKDSILNDYKTLSLSKLYKKYGSTKYLMRSFLVSCGIDIKNPQKLRESIMKNGEKKCSTCNLVLSLDNFHKSNKKSGYKYRCKSCRSKIETRDPEYFKKWSHENKEKKSIGDKLYREKNFEKIKQYRSTLEYKEKKSIWDKKTYEKIKKDPIKNLNARVKSSMSGSIKYSKKNQYFKILGYTIYDLKKRLEQTFTCEMSWENYGKGGWHIDHIKPLVLFDLSKEDEFIKAWSLNNLQALSEKDNLSKGSMYENKRHYRNGSNKKSTKK